jgi:hypothetical protein
MKNFKRAIKILLLMCLFSCSSTQITSSWKSPALGTGKYKKIMVVSIINEQGHNMPQKMEAHLVEDLRQKGIDAVSVYQLYGPGAIIKTDEAAAVEKIRTAGADAIITIVLLDKNNERYYVPGRVYYTPYVVYHRRFWGYYSTMYERVYTPGYYVNNTEYFWESNLYDANTKELLYSVQTKSFDPASVESLAHEYGQLIVNNMLAKAVISQ